MRDFRIVVEPYDFIDLLELEIHKEINEHATAKIRGHIREEDHNKYTKLNNSTEWITISAIGENNDSKILFKGMIKNIKESNYDEVSILSIKAVSSSYLSDISLKTRTFQDGSQTYNDILKRIIQEENQNCLEDIKLSINGITEVNNPINQFIVQYNETNWGFMKRLASHWNAYLVPEYKQTGCKIHFGRPYTGVIDSIEENDYIIDKNLDEYRYKTENEVHGYSELDAMCIRVETREIYDLCEQVNFQNRELYVVGISSILKKGELMHTYNLKSDVGSKVPKYYNYKIIGASLDASISEVERDNVKVKIDIDEGKAKSINRWYPYSTVYSSPDGTGWYFMPEVGDRVRVYFPNEKENDAYIISAVHEKVDNSSNSGGENHQSPRTNPDNKSISTKYGKKINFNPNDIEIIAGDNLYIKITDGEGIEIKSIGSITLDAKEDIVVSSGKNLFVGAGTGITLAKSTGDSGTESNSESEQGKIEITEDKEITLTGKDIKINS